MKDQLRQKLDYQEYTPILADINKYFSDQGFVGDYHTRLALAIAIIRRKCIGIVSGAGGGKSAVVDALLAALPSSQVYTMGSGSDKVQVYKADSINNTDLIYITELQKLGSGETAIEMLKNLGEGKDYAYERTDNGGQGTSTKTIKAGKAIIYTKAIENNYESDAELDRRFPRLTTDMSEAQNQRVVDSKGKRRENPFRSTKLSSKEKNALEYHLSNTLKENANNYVFVNPMGGFLAKKIPTTFAVARTYTDHYLDLIEGCAFFNKSNRIQTEMEIEGTVKKVIFVAPEDAWQMHQIYSEQFLQDVLNIPPNGIHVLNVMKSKKDKSEDGAPSFATLTEDSPQGRMTITDIFNALRKEGYNMPEPLIKKIIIGLMMSGYIRSEIDTSGSRKREYFILNQELQNFQEDFDWKGAIDYAKELMQTEFPNHVGEYSRLYCDTPLATDPWTGEVVNIVGDEIGEAPADDRDNWIVN